MSSLLHFGRGKATTEELKGEMADVKIAIEQLEQLHGTCDHLITEKLTKELSK